MVRPLTVWLVLVRRLMSSPRSYLSHTRSTQSPLLRRPQARPSQPHLPRLRQLHSGFLGASGLPAGLPYGSGVQSNAAAAFPALSRIGKMPGLYSKNTPLVVSIPSSNLSLTVLSCTVTEGRSSLGLADSLAPRPIGTETPVGPEFRLGMVLSLRQADPDSRHPGSRPPATARCRSLLRCSRLTVAPWRTGFVKSVLLIVTRRVTMVEAHSGGGFISPSASSRSGSHGMAPAGRVSSSVAVTFTTISSPTCGRGR